MKKCSFACYNGHEIIFITVMLQGCLSYNPLDSISNGTGHLWVDQLPTSVAS